MFGRRVGRRSLSRRDVDALRGEDSDRPRSGRSAPRIVRAAPPFIARCQLAQSTNSRRHHTVPPAQPPIVASVRNRTRRSKSIRWSGQCQANCAMNPQPREEYIGENLSKAASSSPLKKPVGVDSCRRFQRETSILGDRSRLEWVQDTTDVTEPGNTDHQTPATRLGWLADNWVAGGRAMAMPQTQDTQRLGHRWGSAASHPCTRVD